MTGMENLTLDNIFEQVISGQTPAAQSMRERIKNWRLRRLHQAQRTRILFHEINPTFPGTADEIITAYSDDFNQPLIVVAGITDMVTTLVRLSDTVTNRAWSQEPVPVRIYAGQRSSDGGHQRFAPQIIPPTSRLSADFRNSAVGINPQMAGKARLILTGYHIAPQTAPGSQQELDALKAVEQAINEGTPPKQTTLPATLKLDGIAGNPSPGETRPTDRALLITGLTCNMPATGNGKLTISDSSSNAAWMTDFITWWGVAGETFNGGSPVYYLPKPYYLPAGAILRVNFQNAIAADGGPIGSGTYTFGFVGETP